MFGKILFNGLGRDYRVSNENIRRERKLSLFGYYGLSGSFTIFLADREKLRQHYTEKLAESSVSWRFRTSAQRRVTLSFRTHPA